MKARHTVSQEHVQLSAARPLRAAEVWVTRAVEPHDHDYHELCLVLAGSGWHLTANERRPVRPGTLIVSSPGQVHAFEPGPGMRAFNVYYLTEWFLRELPEWSESPSYFHLFIAPALFNRQKFGPVIQVELGDQLTAAERELRDIVSEDRRARPARAWQRAAFCKFLLLATRAADQQQLGPQTVLSPQVWLALQRLEEMVLAREPFSLSRLAARMSIGSGHLSRIFTAQTGRSPRDYFQVRRLLMASAALLDSTRSITEIGLECGFTDAAHFGRLFRRQHGITPREYRKRYKA